MSIFTTPVLCIILLASIASKTYAAEEHKATKLIGVQSESTFGFDFETESLSLGLSLGLDPVLC